MNNNHQHNAFSCTLQSRRFNFVVTFFCTCFLLFSSLAAFSQHNYDSIFKLKDYHRSFALLTAVVSERKNPPELRKIDSLIKTRGTATDKNLNSFMAALRKFGEENKKYEEAEPVLLEYLHKAEKDGDHYMQGVMNYNIGEYANTQGHYNRAFRYKLYALKELETDPNKKFYGESWMLHQIASEYYLFHDYAKTIELCEQVYNPAPAAGWDTWFTKKTGNLIGMSHLKMNSYDSAKAWFEKTKALAIASHDTAWEGISDGNIGNVYFAQKNCDSAIVLYRKALQLCRAAALWDNVAAFGSSLANCYLITGQIAEVPALLKESREAISKDEYNTSGNYSAYYSVAQSYYRKKGDAATALLYADSLAADNDREDAAYNVNKKLQAEAQLAFNSQQLENEVELQKMKQGRIVLFGLVIVLILLSAIGILLFKRQQLKHRMRSEALEREKQKAGEELSLSMTEIRDFSTTIQEKNDLILQLMLENDALKLELGLPPDEAGEKVDR